MTGISAHGLVTVYSAPRALLTHVEWTVSRLVDQPVEFNWQPVAGSNGEFACEFEWQADFELGASLASELRGWANIRFEVTQQASDQTEGYRWAYTPTLGMFSGQTDRFGNVLVNEHQLQLAMRTAAGSGLELQRLINRALGIDWDLELESFRVGNHEPTKLRSIG